MQDQPDALAVLQAVTHFLREEAIPQLSGRLAFDARVAANALDIVERELRLGPNSDSRELASLRHLLGEDGTLAVLNQRLCTAIATGRMDLNTPGLAEHLWQTTLAKLAIDQPNYRSYRAALETPET